MGPKKKIVQEQPVQQIVENIPPPPVPNPNPNPNLNQEQVQVNVDWKTQFNQLINFEKPEDELDCKVTLNEGLRCDYSKIKNGSLLYRPARIIVLEKTGLNGNSRVRNQDLHKEGLDGDWNLGTDLINKQCWTPDQYTKIEKVSASVLAHKLREEVGDCICKVEFTKSPDLTEMANLIKDGSRLIENSGLPDAEKLKLYKKLYERSQKGEYRIMRGYIIRDEDMQIKQNDTGMIKFLDADILAKGEMAERLINLKNIVSITFKLTKYQLK